MRLAMLFPVGLLFSLAVGPDCAVVAGDPKDVLLNAVTADPDEQVRWTASSPLESFDTEKR
jgi:hypothetical protein